MAGVSAWLAVVAIHSRRGTESWAAWQRHRQVETDRCEHCSATWEVSDREAVEMIGPRDHYVIPSAVGWQVATFVCSQGRLIPSLARCMSLFVPRSNTPVHVLFDQRYGSGACNAIYEPYSHRPSVVDDPENKWNYKDEESLQRLCPKVLRQWGQHSVLMPDVFQSTSTERWSCKRQLTLQYFSKIGPGIVKTLQHASSLNSPMNTGGGRCVRKPATPLSHTPPGTKIGTGQLKGFSR